MSTMTPEEKTKIFDAFDESKAARVQALIEAVLAYDLKLARSYAEALVDQDRILFEITKMMAEHPLITPVQVADYVREQIKKSSTTPPQLTSWERLLGDDPV